MTYTEPTNAAPNKSLAGTFPNFNATRVSRHSATQNTAPEHMQETLALAWLSTRGAMAPEGCTKRTLERAVKRFDLSPKSVLTLCAMLWEAQLLGWHPTYVRELSFKELDRLTSERIQVGEWQRLYDRR